MTWLAMDTSSSRLTVAAQPDDGTAAERHLDGPRQHARALLGLVNEALNEVGSGLASVRQLLVADGPGSFTGLRVSATVAKALHDSSGVEVLVASTLLARAVPYADHGTVLVTTDALRGDVYAAVYQFEGAVVRALVPPCVLPAGTAEGLAPHAVTVADAVPDARSLLTLRAWEGGLHRLHDVSGWVPVYGRLAEAQAKWEREHGRPLAHSPRLAR